MTEFDIIRHYFQRHIKPRPDVILGSGDDCALLQIPTGSLLAVSIDSFVEGTHFLPNTAAYDIGWKAVAVSLSDGAAMGANPLWLTLALTLPHSNQDWLAEFSRGVFALLKQHDVQLVGGDLTRGACSITTQIHGTVTQAHALKRSGAQSGDDIYVSGKLGDAGLALATLQNRLPKLSTPQQAYIEQRLHRPTPRVEIGKALGSFAHAAIDISDGLTADLGHILKQSGVGAEIALADLPLSAALQTLSAEIAWNLALTAGDDYELCFTAAPHHSSAIAAIAQRYHTPLTRIGTITAQPGLRLLQADGSLYQPDMQGFQHFA